MVSLCIYWADAYTVTNRSSGKCIGVVHLCLGASHARTLPLTGELSWDGGGTLMHPTEADTDHTDHAWTATGTRNGVGELPTITVATCRRSQSSDSLTTKSQILMNGWRIQLVGLPR